MADQEDLAKSVSSHYGSDDPGSSILKSLAEAGKDLEALTVDDLSAVDQFHSRGKQGTLELAALAQLSGGEQVLDVGGGIGGPARLLAHEFGCQVTVLDLTPTFVEAGRMLTERVGLADSVTFRQGSALAMPFPDASFDVAWTQHSSMNIEVKERLYSEVRRVLRPGGRLAIHEIMAGANSPIHFPVPWAPDLSISFLRPVEAVRQLLSSLGFTELAWRDSSAETLAWMRERRGSGQGGPPPAAAESLERNLAEDRVAVVQAVLRRP